MTRARRRPVGNHDEELSALLHCGTKNFGETEVIANKRRNHDVPPVEKQRTLSSGIMLRLAAISERMHFAVASNLPAFGGENDGLIPSSAVGHGRNQSA